MEYEIWKHGLRDMEVGNYGAWYIDKNMLKVGCTELSSARDGYHFQITTLHILPHSLKIDVFYVPLFHDNGSKNHTASKMFLL